jgi:hypothetical protein
MRRPPAAMRGILARRVALDETGKWAKWAKDAALSPDKSLLEM